MHRYTAQRVAARPHDEPPARAALAHYFFYGWLFRDADSGSSLERSAAIRHNSDQARWLPTYMSRWFVGGGVLLALQAFAEHVLEMPWLTAIFAVMVIFVVMFQIVTVICWAFLQSGRQARR